MGYRVAACVVSAAEVGGSHLRERLFILAHADVPHGRQPRRRRAVSGGSGLPQRSQPDRQTGWPEERGDLLDLAPRSDGGDRLDPRPLPPFPPAPGDLALWRETLGLWPDLEPCLLRLDDGLATRMDRSAAVGNGVVPLAAARAWTMLKQALSEAQNSPFPPKPVPSSPRSNAGAAIA